MALYDHRLQQPILADPEPLRLIQVLNNVYQNVRHYHYEHRGEGPQKVDIEWMEDMIRTDFWSIVSALRGPDSDDYQLKWLTTARIRAVIGLDISEPIDINPRPLNREELEHRTIMLRDTFRHFADHFEMAKAVIYKVYGVEI
jgi:hypothetical protein